MAQASSIEWTNSTWNPTRGCTEIAPGCAHCYAKTFAERWRGIAGHPYEQGFDPRIAPDKLAEPLKWKKPRRIFVDSMSDLFHEAFADDYTAACLGVMAACPQHTFQVLTKRPQRVVEFFGWLETQHHDGRYRHPEIIEHGACVAEGLGQLEAANRLFRAANASAGRNAWPLPNVQIGTSIANQTDADKNIPHLLRVPAAVRFLSVEPLIGPVDLSQWIAPRDAWQAGHLRCCSLSYPEVRSNIFTGGCRCLHWVIVGGESGPGARPCNVEWIRSIVAQCKAAGVPVFVKQLGRRPMGRATFRPFSGAPIVDDDYLVLKDKKGGDWNEWPADLRIREFPREVAA